MGTKVYQSCAQVYTFVVCAQTHVIYMETRLPRIVFDRKGHTIDETLCTIYIFMQVPTFKIYIHTKHIIKVSIIITN